MPRHPHLSEVLAAGESPRHLLTDYLVRPWPGTVLTETYANELINAVIAEAIERRAAEGARGGQ